MQAFGVLLRVTGDTCQTQAELPVASPNKFRDRVNQRMRAFISNKAPGEQYCHSIALLVSSVTPEATQIDSVVNYYPIPAVERSVMVSFLARVAALDDVTKVNLVVADAAKAIGIEKAHKRLYRRLRQPIQRGGTRAL